MYCTSLLKQKLPPVAWKMVDAWPISMKRCFRQIECVQFDAPWSFFWQQKSYCISLKCSLLFQTNNKENELAKIKNDYISVSRLPEHQRNIIHAFCDAVKHPTGPPMAKGRRYKQQWIYQCVLLKIKSYKSYRFMRRHKILPLPAPSTLHKYIRTLRASFGFQQKLFDTLKEKAKYMPSAARRGTNESVCVS